MRSYRDLKCAVSTRGGSASFGKFGGSKCRLAVSCGSVGTVAVALGTPGGFDGVS